MEALAELLGMESQELIRLFIVGALLSVGVFSMRVVFKMAKSMVKIGCFASILVLAAIYLLSILG